MKDIILEKEAFGGSRDLPLRITHSKDDVILVNDEFIFFGYGKTYELARQMLISVLKETKQDLVNKVINSKNMRRDMYESLVELFLPWDQEIKNGTNNLTNINVMVYFIFNRENLRNRGKIQSIKIFQGKGKI